jgi:hypothetical protein
LRFDGWDLADADDYRRVLFEINGLHCATDSTIRYFWSLRDTSNVAHGVNYAARGDGIADVAYNNGTANQSTTVAFNPARIGRDQKHTIGVGFEIDTMFGAKDVLMTYGGKVHWRKTESTLSLAGTLRPALAVQVTSGTKQVYCHGARLRIWRHR